jgi:UV DNA damage endonuclease
MRYGLCCISLDLQELEEPFKFQTITYKRFSSLDREDALELLGERILNNMIVTNATIKHCAVHDMCYRMSSDLFPLITYEKASVDLTDLPNHDDIQDAFDTLEETISSTGVRISCHPSEFNVLASMNLEAVNRTVDELNFYSSFMDRIGCAASYASPINLHVQNRDGTHEEVLARFSSNFDRLDANCKARLVLENDDKANCWSVRQLVDVFHSRLGIPVTFDYLHHKCHSDGLSEREAFELAHQTWDVKPLFHYSESRSEDKPRAHADYALNKFEVYQDADIDFELKMKDKAIHRHRGLDTN